MEKFFETVAQFVQLSQKSKDALTAILKRLELSKGDILVRPNTICHHFYFIEKGLTRTFYYKDDKDVTDWLSAENMFAVSLISFMTVKPDRRGIELLEDSILWSLHHDDFEKLCEKFHDIEHFARLLSNFGLLMVQQRFDDLHFASALERYQTLMNNNPTFIQRVPLGIIASYLGITQETLSRIRSQI